MTYKEWLLLAEEHLRETKRLFKLIDTVEDVDESVRTEAQLLLGELTEIIDEVEEEVLS